MLEKGSKLYSVIKMKCPQCHEGEFFISQPYDLKKAGDIYANCSVCGLKYAKEPGFYYGAMYVAYGIGVGLFVSLWTTLTLFFPQVSVGGQIAAIVIITLILSPYIYSLSKIIWANLFIKYDPSKRDYSQNAA